MPAISIFDLHHHALAAWRREGGPRPLVHLDAHLDAEPYEHGDLHIGNVVRAAASEGVIDRIAWVIPDPLWESAPSRKVIEEEFARATAGTGRIEGVPVSLTVLDRLVGGVAPAFLDIDLDYLFFVSRAGDHDRPADRPWTWPRTIVARLAACDLRVAAVTMATSITGGFTPMRWRHLAGELALRLAGRDGPELEVFAHIAAAAPLGPAARAAALQAFVAEAASAAAWFHLAEALQDDGRLEAARMAFREAVSREPEYRHLYRTDAPLDHAQGRHDRARAGYERALALDPLDPFSRIGLAQLAAGEGRLAAAERLYEEALALPGGDQIDAWRGLARVLEERDADGAIRAYERSLLLALRGQVPLSVVAHGGGGSEVLDPGHCETYLRLAALHARAGRTAEATANERLAAAIQRGTIASSPSGL